MNLVAPAGDEMDASGQDFKSQVALNSRASLLRPAQSVSECSHAPLVLNGLSHFAVLYPHLAASCSIIPELRTAPTPWRAPASANLAARDSNALPSKGSAGPASPCLFALSPRDLSAENMTSEGGALVTTNHLNLLSMKSLTRLQTVSYRTAKDRVCWFPSSRGRPMPPQSHLRT
jgi:hypothetical protein